MAYSYYIYYRVAPERAQSCEAKVLELLSTMKQAANVTGRLLKKRSEPLLWMEVYEDVRDDATFEFQLEQAAGRPNPAAFLQEGSARRIECFEA